MHATLTISSSIPSWLRHRSIIYLENYIGANAKDVESAVATILEQAINSVEGMLVSSPAPTTAPPPSPSPSTPGTTSISPPSTSRDRIASAREDGNFHAVVNNTGITITKAGSDFIFRRWIHLLPTTPLSQALHLQLPRRLCQ